MSNEYVCSLIDKVWLNTDDIQKLCSCSRNSAMTIRKEVENIRSLQRHGGHDGHGVPHGRRVRLRSDRRNGRSGHRGCLRAGQEGRPRADLF